MKIEQVRELIAGGSECKAIVREKEDGFFITFNFSRAMYSSVDLTTARKSLRCFKTLDAACSLLRDLKIHRFEVWA